MPEEFSLSSLEKFRPIILIIAIFVGLFVGFNTLAFNSYADAIISIFLVVLVYSLFLSVSIERVEKSFGNLRFFSLTWAVNFVIIPIIAYILALLFLKDNPAIFIGFILYLVTPCTDWFLTFTSMAKGDTALGLALMPTNLILQIVLIPVYLFLFAGELVSIQTSTLLETFLIFVILPLVLSIVTRWIVRRVKGEKKGNKATSRFSVPLQTLALTVVIFSIFASQTQTILNNYETLAIVFIPIVIFFVVSFAIAQVVSKTFNLSYKECALFTCTTAARNSPLALPIAIALFPNQPLIHVALIIGVIIELPILILIVKALEKIRLNYYRKA